MDPDKEKEFKSEDEKFKEKVKDILIQLSDEHDRIKKQIHRKTSDDSWYNSARLS